MTMVPLSEGNIAACICPECPVQLKSKCSAQKPKEARLYCAKGIAACKDLDESQMCICSNCPVFKDYGLSKAKWAYKFCLKGKAEEK